MKLLYLFTMECELHEVSQYERLAFLLESRKCLIGVNKGLSDAWLLFQLNGIPCKVYNKESVGRVRRITNLVDCNNLLEQLSKPSEQALA